jgi:hypothetical protein
VLSTWFGSGIHLRFEPSSGSKRATSRLRSASLSVALAKVNAPYQAQTSG